MTLGKRIKQLRKNANLTLKDVANCSDLSVSYLSDIERGRTDPSYKTMIRLADSFSVPLAYIIAGVEHDHTPVDVMPPSLVEFMESTPFADSIDKHWINLLTSIHLNGTYPKTSEQWAIIYLTLRQILK